MCKTERAAPNHADGFDNMLRSLARNGRRGPPALHPRKNPEIESRPISERVFPVPGSGNSLRLAAGGVDKTPSATQSSTRLRTSRPSIQASADKATHVGSRSNEKCTDIENAGDRRDVAADAIHELPEICRVTAAIWRIGSQRGITKNGRGS